MNTPTDGSESMSEGRVVDLNSSGEGVLREPSGRVVFVEGVWPGERIRYVITEQKKSWARATVFSWIERSPSRRESPCPHAPTKKATQRTTACGGCPWIELNYDAQIQAKSARIQKELQRIKSVQFDTGAIRPMIPSPREFAYRNRARMVWDGSHWGFRARGSHAIVPIRNCMVCNARVNELLSAAPSGRLGDADDALDSNEFLIIDDQMSASDLRSNQERSFRQGNTEQNLAMRLWLDRVLETQDGEVLELFAGDGNFTEVIQKKTTGQIWALDHAIPSINQWPRVRWVKSDLRRASLVPRTLRIQDLDHFAVDAVNTLVLDPPREGCAELFMLVEQLPALTQLIYISCDLASLVRDLSHLENDWSVVEVQPIDLFPQTPHVELMVFLHKLYKKTEGI